MGRTIIKSLTSASLALLLAACTTTPEEPATTTSAEAGRPSESKPGAQTQPLARSRVPSSDQRMAAPAGAPKSAGDSLSQRSIYYDYDRFDIKDEYRGIIEAHAKNLRDNPNSKMVIQGHADERGSREYNLALGQRRAEQLCLLAPVVGEGDVSTTGVLPAQGPLRLAVTDEEHVRLACGRRHCATLGRPVGGAAR